MVLLCWNIHQSMQLTFLSHPVFMCNFVCRPDVLAVSWTRLGWLPRLLDSRTKASPAGLLYRICLETGQPDNHQHIDGQLGGAFRVDRRPAGLFPVVSTAKKIRELHEFASCLSVQVERPYLRPAAVPHLRNRTLMAKLTRKPSWRKGCARQQCVYTAILDFWNFKVAPLVRPSPKTLP